MKIYNNIYFSFVSADRYGTGLGWLRPYNKLPAAQEDDYRLLGTKEHDNDKGVLVELKLNDDEEDLNISSDKTHGGLRPWYFRRLNHSSRRHTSYRRLRHVKKKLRTRYGWVFVPEGRRPLDTLASGLIG